MSNDNTIVSWKYVGEDQLSKVLATVNKKIDEVEKNVVDLDKGLDKAMKSGAKSIDYLSSRMENLKKIKNASFDEKQIRKYNDEIRKTQIEIDRLDRLSSTKKKGLSVDMGSVVGGLPGGGMLASMMNPAGLVAGGIGIASMFGVSAFNEQQKVQTMMAKINGTAKLSRFELEALEDQLFRMAQEAEVAFDTVPAGLEKILSATGDLDLSMDILKESLKGAKSGFTDIQVVGEGVAQVLAIVGKNKTNATEVLDVFTAAKNFGKGEFGDFSARLPRLISQSNNLGFSFKETAGAYAFMTKMFSADQSQTLLENVFVNLQDTKKSKSLKKTLGVDLFDGSGKVRDFAELMKDINSSLDGLTDEQRLAKLDKVGFDAQASSGISVLSKGYRDLAAGIDEVTNSQGQLNESMKFTKDGSEAITEMSNNWKKFKNNIGEGIAPMVNSLLVHLNDPMNDPVSQNHDERVQRRDKMLASWGINVNSGSDEKPLIEQYRSQFPALKRMFEKNPVGLVTKLNLGNDEMSKLQKMITADPMQIKATLGIDDAYLDKIMDFMGVGHMDGSTSAMQRAGIYVPSKKKKGSDPVGKVLDEEKRSKQESDVVNGGRQVRNVTVNIQNLAKIEKIETTNIQQGVSDIKDMLSEELVRVVRDAEISLNTY